MFCEKKVLYAEITVSGFKRIASHKPSCTDCGFICPQIRKPNFHGLPKVYAVQLKDEYELLNSTSGGMFTAVSQYVFDQQGVVFGAIYKDHLQVKHTMAENMDQLMPMRGSKYIQSDISECYKKIRQQLDDGRLVLFSGLPCQVAGVYAYLGKTYEHLITMDLICSGIPSQKLFDSYIEYIENKHRIKIVDFRFRDKHKYGLSHTVVITYINKQGRTKIKTIKDRNAISYYIAFGKQNCFMDSCYSCHYNTINRISDLTVGGFWSIRHTSSQLNEYKGISLVLSNTCKSESIIKWIRKNSIAYVEEHALNIAVIDNAALVTNTPYIHKDLTLYKDLHDKGYRYTSIKHFRVRKKIETVIRYIVRKIRNKIFEQFMWYKG
jgi:coenzyme F420-reducing hydrogenase beta subunit